MRRSGKRWLGEREKRLEKTKDVKNVGSAIG